VFDRLRRLRATGLYLMPPGSDVLANPEPLRHLILAGRDQGLEVHVGLLPFADPPDVAMETSRRRYRFEDQGRIQCDGLCPAWHENRLLALNRARRLLETFEPDGLHLDHVRYNFANSEAFGQDLEWEDGGKWLATYLRCQCPMCQSERLDLLDHQCTVWDEYHPGFVFSTLRQRHTAVTRLMKQMQELCAQSGTRLSIAARVHYLGRALIEGQDWMRWARKGLVDIISPMNYSTSAQVVKQRLETNQRLLGHTTAKVLEGLGRKSSAGEPTSEEFAAQVRVVLEAGLPGVAVYRLSDVTERDCELLREFA
jgi:hypothetical protein